MHNVNFNFFSNCSEIANVNYNLCIESHSIHGIPIDAFDFFLLSFEASYSYIVVRRFKNCECGIVTDEN